MEPPERSPWLLLSPPEGCLWPSGGPPTTSVLLQARGADGAPGCGSAAVFRAVAFSGDGRTCAVVDGEGGLVLIHLEQNRFARCPAVAGASCAAAAAAGSPAALCFARRHPAEAVLLGEESSVRVFDVETGRPAALLGGHRGWVRAACASGPQALLVLTQSADLTILWDSAGWTRLRSMQAVAEPARGASFSLCGQLCGVLFGGSRVAIWRSSGFEFEREVVALDSPGLQDTDLRHFALGGRHVVAGGSTLLGGGRLVMWHLDEAGPPRRSTSSTCPHPGCSSGPAAPRRRGSGPCSCCWTAGPSWRWTSRNCGHCGPWTPRRAASCLSRWTARRAAFCFPPPTAAWSCAGRTWAAAPLARQEPQGGPPRGVARCSPRALGAHLRRSRARRRGERRRASAPGCETTRSSQPASTAAEFRRYCAAAAALRSCARRSGGTCCGPGPGTPGPTRSWRRLASTRRSATSGSGTLATDGPRCGSWRACCQPWPTGSQLGQRRRSCRDWPSRSCRSSETTP
ncbi:unnamed protein product [Prorocentrum cordatum]|uniref:Cilia- and flagella-associated protein 43 n=1 Tax=Prorocentrum cordatum TaxID=2364126 RepID=A0ABN9TJ05_9DINO|nr:unnamed protein product [Polarella glacialis]